MNSVIVIGLLVFAVIAVTSGQDSLMQMMMMQNMMRGGNRANYPPQQTGSQSYTVGQGSSGGQTAGLGGGGGMNMLALTQMGDTARNMYLCNMYAGQMRMMCMMGMV